MKEAGTGPGRPVSGQGLFVAESVRSPRSKRLTYICLDIPPPGRKSVESSSAQLICRPAGPPVRLAASLVATTWFLESQIYGGGNKSKLKVCQVTSSKQAYEQSRGRGIHTPGVTNLSTLLFPNDT